MKNKQAFTLVELIVVITILAILGTIAFLSFQGYSRDARDSVRISDLNNISRGMEFILTKTGRLPVPEDSVEITASGTIISYQGYAGENVLSTIGVNNGGKDPKDDDFYTYVSNANYTKYQLLGFLENGDQIGLGYISNVNADLSERYPETQGFELGIIIDSVNNEPIQFTGTGIDIVGTINSYNVYLNNSDTGIVSGTGSKLAEIGTYNSKFKSCNDIVDTYGTSIESKEYTIYLNGENYYRADCDMQTDGGGWMKLPTSIDTLEDLFSWQLTDDETKNLTGTDRYGESYSGYPKYLVSVDDINYYGLNTRTLDSFINYKLGVNIPYTEYKDGPTEYLYNKVVFKGPHSGKMKIRSETGVGSFFHVNTEYVLIR